MRIGRLGLCHRPLHYASRCNQTLSSQKDDQPLTPIGNEATCLWVLRNPLSCSQKTVNDLCEGMQLKGTAIVRIRLSVSMQQHDRNGEFVQCMSEHRGVPFALLLRAKGAGKIVLRRN